MIKFRTTSGEETFALAQKLGEMLNGGELLALEGDLGAGKTLFVKGLAKGLEIQEEVTSPTFVLMHIYEGRLTLAHFDIYRLPVPEAIEELGYEEYFYGSGVIAVEWADLIPKYLPEEHLQIIIRRDEKENHGETREITFVPHGETMIDLVKELSDNAGIRN